MAVPATLTLPAQGRGTPVRRRNRRWFHFLVVASWVGMALSPLVPGWSYYLTPLSERGSSALHDTYKPSGAVGHTLGLAGSIMMLGGVAMYSLRKRFRLLSRLGRLRSWLDVHIFLCTLGPVLVMWHTSFKIGGIVSVSFWSMVIVVTSGVIGRYVYVRIPMTVNGQFVSVEMIAREERELVSRIVTDFGLAEESVLEILGRFEKTTRRSAAGYLLHSFVFDLTRRSRETMIRKAIKTIRMNEPRKRALAEEIHGHLRLHHQLAIMQSFRRLFGYWHVLHLPLATVMFLIMFVHIAISALFGYGWVL